MKHLCIGVDGKLCKNEFIKTSPNHIRCVSCSKLNAVIVRRDYRAHVDRVGMCRSHCRTPIAPGKSKCQYCLDNAKSTRKDRVKSGFCGDHPSVVVVKGKSRCLVCLDRRSIYRLPKKAQDAAQKRANETREARSNGTYKCPILGYTEVELVSLFPSKSTKTVWEFDHTGDMFRDIISGSANRALKTFSAEQLLSFSNYVRQKETHV